MTTDLHKDEYNSYVCMLRIVPVNKSLLCPISTGLQFHHFNSISLSSESLLNNYIWEITFLSVTVNCPCYCSFEVLALVWNSGPLTPTSKRSFCRKPMGAHCHLMVNYRRSTSALLQYTLQPWRIKKLQVWNQIAKCFTLPIPPVLAETVELSST